MNLFQLSDVGISDGSKDLAASFARSLTEHPLHFGYAEGKVTGLCPSSDEDTWALNMKRGILSTFSNAMRDGVETDVVGKCPTVYSAAAVADWNGMEEWSKVKDMTQCQGNQKLNQYALNIPDVNVQKMPLLE
jgi:hypothetical protein